MKNVNEILERQHAHLKFEDGKVKYFSISTQHSKADTIKEAVKNIIEVDEYLDGKSWLRYIVDKCPFPENIPSEPISKESIEKAMDILKEDMRKNFYIGIDLANGKDFSSY